MTAHIHAELIKMPTININGHEVPEPTRTPLEEETKYYIPDFSDSSLASHFYWAGDEVDRHCLVAGLIHRTKEDAIAHAKALLSFTAKPEHTPGPWHIQQGDDGQTLIKPVPGQVVAAVEPQINPEEARSNARLIAAAPEMHALLLQIHTELAHAANADPDPENWEGYTLHRIEKLLWPEGSNG